MRTILPRRLGPRVLLAVFILSALIYLSILGDSSSNYGRHRGQRHLEPEEKQASLHAVARAADVQRPLPASGSVQALPISTKEHPKQADTDPVGVVDRSGHSKAAPLREETGRLGKGNSEEEGRIDPLGILGKEKEEAKERSKAAASFISTATADLQQGTSSTGSTPTSSAATSSDPSDPATTTAATTSRAQDNAATFSSGPGPTTSRSTNVGGLAVADDYLTHIKEIVQRRGLTIDEAASTCKWDSKAPVNFQYGPSTDWVKHERNASEIASRRSEWQDFITNDAIPYANVESHISGRGVVICAGNERSLKRLHVLLRLLTDFNTTLPVEIHYYTEKEISFTNRTSLTAAYPHVSFNDLSLANQTFPTTAPGFINYNLKLAALLNTRFAEVLLIDSDNVPVADPTPLFSSETYKTHGTVFWPDIARTRPQNPAWSLTNTPCRTDEYEQESGQLLVDKRRFWYHLQLAAWFGHQDYYSAFLLGDKDCFRFAWHALKTEYGRPKRWLASVGMVQRPIGMDAFPANVSATSTRSQGHEESKSVVSHEQRAEQRAQGGPHSVYCGHSFAQHAPDSADSPIAFLHGGLIKTLNPQQIAHARNHSTGLFSAYKRSKSADTHMSAVEGVGIKYDGGLDYLGDEVLGLTAQRGDGGEETKGLEHIAQCVDMRDVLPGAVGDEETGELEGFEQVFEKAGGFWMLDE